MVKRISCFVLLAAIICNWTAADAGESCCVLRGDMNCDGKLNSADLIFAVDYLWNWGPDPCCWEHFDVNGDGTCTSADVIYLFDYFYKGGPAPVPCP